MHLSGNKKKLKTNKLSVQLKKFGKEQQSKLKHNIVKKSGEKQRNRGQHKQQRGAVL